MMIRTGEGGGLFCRTNSVKTEKKLINFSKKEDVIENKINLIYIF